MRKCEETPVDHQFAVCYAFHHDNEHDTAETTNNPLFLPNI